MKITDVKIEPFQIKLTEPLRVTFSEFTYSENVLIKIQTDEGIEGYGEAAPLAYVTGELPEGTIAALRLFRKGLIGRDPMDVAGAHQMMNATIHGNGSAKCAVDLALYDIIGKAKGLPVYKILSGTDPHVVSDVTLGIDTPEHMAALAKQRVQEGFRILKLKAGIDPEADVRAVAAVRTMVGDGVRIRVDANQGYDIETAINTIEKMKPYGVEAVEQCLPDWNVEGSAEIRSRTSGIKIMLDESIHTTADARRAAACGAADTFNIKLMKCGGLYPGMQISDIGQQHGINCMVGCMFESRLAITAGISLVAAKANITEADCDSFLFYKDEATGITGGFARTGGNFTLLDEPGLGIHVKF